MTCRVRLIVLAALTMGVPAVAGAQTAPAPSPLVVESLHTPLIVAPDYTVTEVDGERRQLAGAYAGLAFDDVLFVGGAGRWMVDGGRGESLGYGGLLVGWSTPPVAGLQIGVRGLVGGGRATLGRTVTTARGPRFSGGSPLATFRVLEREDFFVFEPQAGVTGHLAPHVALSLAGGYRLTGFTRALDDRLNGATGSVALQLQW